MKIWTRVAALVLALQGVAYAQDSLRAAIDAPQRTPAFAARDAARHPYETLSFFGVKPDQTVVELSPGGGWYTEILAPYLRDKGRLVLAADAPADASDNAKRGAARMRAKLEKQPELYGKVEMGVFAPPAHVRYIAPGTADVVLTFRNVHNWISISDNAAKTVFQSAFDSLKPGGVFGVVEHRLPAKKTQDKEASSGYVHQAYVVKLAESVGFKLAASSEVNANPKDTADHDGGVWALPPVLANKDKDRTKYEAIGESDRMTLKFVKP